MIAQDEIYGSEDYESFIVRILWLSYLVKSTMAAQLSCTKMSLNKVYKYYIRMHINIINQGLYSLGVKSYYHQISWNFWSREIWVESCLVALKFYRCPNSSAAEALTQFRTDTIILAPELAASWLLET